MKRWVKRVSFAALLAATISGGYLGLRHYGARPAARVKVVSIGSPKLSEVSTQTSRARSPASRAEMGAPRSDGPEQPSAGVRSVTSAKLIGKLEHQSSLSDAERKRLVDVFRLASNIQLGIDAERSGETKEALQRRLVEQVELRLKLILRDERRVSLATAELQGLPRIDADG